MSTSQRVLRPRARKSFSLGKSQVMDYDFLLFFWKETPGPSWRDYYHISAIPARPRMKRKLSELEKDVIRPTPTKKRKASTSGKPQKKLADIAKALAKGVNNNNNNSPANNNDGAESVPLESDQPFVPLPRLSSSTANEVANNHDGAERVHLESDHRSSSTESQSRKSELEAISCAQTLLLDDLERSDHGCTESRPGPSGDDDDNDIDFQMLDIRDVEQLAWVPVFRTFNTLYVPPGVCQLIKSKFTSLFLFLFFIT
jgi:hypothetical protein